MCEDRLYSVYRHSSPSGKIYIGITSMKPEQRWEKGRGYISNQYFYRAIQKYGWDAFDHAILASGLSEDEAYTMERELIALHDSTNPSKGYNISTGGEMGSVGCHHTEEWKKWASETRSGENNPFYGRRHTEETCKAISDANKGRTSPNKGKSPSDEARKKMSLAKKGVYQGYNNPKYGTHHSEETRKKLREKVHNRDLNGGKNPNAHRVLQVDIAGQIVRVFDCINDAGNYLGIPRTTMSGVVNSNKFYKGYAWIKEV